MDVGRLSPRTAQSSSTAGSSHRRRCAPTAADPVSDGRWASRDLPGGRLAGGRRHSPAPDSRLCAHPPVSEPADGPGRRTRLPGPLPAGAPARVKAFDLLPFLIRLVADEERTDDPAGFLQKLHQRLEDMLHRPSSYHFSAADRLVPWVAPAPSVTDPMLRSTVVTSVLTTSWDADRAARRARLAAVVPELAPILRYKADKQKDLDEVRHLEWRLLTALGDTQAEIKRLENLLAVYECLPLWQRLGMHAMGSNVATMKENCALYEAQKQECMNELEVAQARINELKPEAHVDLELRPEYEELRGEIERLGGVTK